jgi:uncharacterized protein YrzB (UPF0473 family)
MGQQEELGGDFGPDIISVVDEDGKEHVFEELDRIETEKGHFVAVAPLSDDEDEDEDEGAFYILQVEEEGEESFLSAIEDEKLESELAEIFEKRLEEKFPLLEDDEED